MMTISAMGAGRETIPRWVLNRHLTDPSVSSIA
jgi:hypothetical protein